MTRPGSEKTSILLLGFLALAATGCPREHFVLGADGKAGSGGTAGAAGSGTTAGNGTAGNGTTAGSGASGKSCGSRGLAACADDQFCSFPASASCGETDKPGVCKSKPEVCTDQYDPVCGCDGKTYGNACEADAAGISARAKGECKSTGGPSCGGLIGKACPKTQYCDYPPDAICGAADATGVCMDKPQACDAIYKPVCGCDDKTYGNDCEAHTAGVSVVSEGECKPSGGGQICGGGLAGNSCPTDQFCDTPPEAICGAADGTGVCRSKPSACTLEYAPVCGCDGMTYGNACAAASAGVSVASKGECGAPSAGVCGTRGAAPCADNEYCAFTLDAQCGAADAPGKCAKKPDACTLQLAEVCGCDGKTYGNECTANSLGTAVAHTGACEPSGSMCGGFAGVQCTGNQYCNFPTATNCGSGDQAGQCADKPTACTKEFHEVCGCDGKTYSNPCMAASAGAAIQKDGACAPAGSGQTCGGLQGAQCPSGEYCDFPESAQCGAADQTGTCATIPDICTADYTPVCGCDDKTYGNACGAHNKSVSVAHQGEC